MNEVNSQLETSPIDGGPEGCRISSSEETVGEGGHFPQGRVGRTGTTAGHVESHLSVVLLPTSISYSGILSVTSRGRAF